MISNIIQQTIVCLPVLNPHPDLQGQKHISPFTKKVTNLIICSVTLFINPLGGAVDWTAPPGSGLSWAGSLWIMLLCWPLQSDY